MRALFFLMVVLMTLLICPVFGSNADQDKEQDTEEVTEKAAEKAAEKAVEKVTEKVTEEAAEKAAEKAVEKVAEKAAEKVAEKAAEKAMEKAAEKAEEMDKLKTKRPDEWKGPTQVHFLVFVVDIDKIDDAEQNFAGNVYIHLRWKDDRLISPEGVIRQIPLEEVWNPNILLINRVGLVSKSLPEIVQVRPDGNVTYRQRYTGKMSQPLRLSEFPLDRHIFTIQFVAAGYAFDDLEFVPDTAAHDPNLVGGAMARELSLPDWKVVKYEAIALPYEPIEGLKVAGFAFRFEAKRYVAYYIWQVVLPLTVVVVMSWAAFWIDAVHVGVRIGVATSSILTMIAHRFVLANLLPRLPYMTRMDYFTVGSTLLVFLSLVMVIWTGSLERRQLTERARIIDCAARPVFPILFAFLCGWFLLG